MIKIDALGDFCPIPMIKLQNKIKEIKSKNSYEDILLVTDHSCTNLNIKLYLEDNNIKYEIKEPINGVFEFYIYLNKTPLI